MRIRVHQEVYRCERFSYITLVFGREFARKYNEDAEVKEDNEGFVLTILFQGISSPFVPDVYLMKKLTSRILRVCPDFTLEQVAKFLAFKLKEKQVTFSPELYLQLKCYGFFWTFQYVELKFFLLSRTPGFTIESREVRSLLLQGGSQKLSRQLNDFLKKLSSWRSLIETKLLVSPIFLCFFDLVDVLHLQDAAVYRR